MNPAGSGAAHDRPLVGISTYREVASFGVWREQADLLPSAYAEAVRTAGGVPVLLPPVLPYGPSARGVVDRVDALVIAGGADVAPATYGASPHPRTGAPRDDRDGWELALLDAVVGAGVPTLGVCRGMQVMAVHAGGVLTQHVPDLVGHDGHDPGGDGYGETAVRIEGGSVLVGLVGRSAVVRCHHHQAVSTHPGFTAVAWAADGTLEAMEREVGEHPFFVGVQWHPEVVPDAGLFRGLVDAAHRGPRQHGRPRRL